MEQKVLQFEKAVFSMCVYLECIKKMEICSTCVVYSPSVFIEDFLLSIFQLNSYRSVDVKLTPLMYAVLEENHRAIKALLTVKKKKYANPPETLLEYQSSGK